MADVELTQEDDALTVVRGCLQTVLQNWDRLTQAERVELLTAALRGSNTLIRLHSVGTAPR